MIIQPSRRGFITGIASLIVAPAVVRAESLMPVKMWFPESAPMIFVSTPTPHYWCRAFWDEVELKAREMVVTFPHDERLPWDSFK